MFGGRNELLVWFIVIIWVSKAIVLVHTKRSLLVSKIRIQSTQNNFTRDQYGFWWIMTVYDITFDGSVEIIPIHGDAHVMFVYLLFTHDFAEKGCCCCCCCCLVPRKLRSGYSLVVDRVLK